LDWNWSRKHDVDHVLNPLTDNSSSGCIQVDVAIWFEQILPDLSMGIQHYTSQGQKVISLTHVQILESFVQELQL
jgi:hypothetical protein